MKKNLYIGGYSILDLNDTNVYAQALICAKQNKPVLVYDDPERYFADTIAISGDDVVITKGGKTITITDANSVSSVGDIQEKIPHFYLYVTNEFEDEYEFVFNAVVMSSIDNLSQSDFTKANFENKKIVILNISSINRNYDDEESTYDNSFKISYTYQFLDDGIKTIGFSNTDIDKEAKGDFYSKIPYTLFNDEYKTKLF